MYECIYGRVDVHVDAYGAGESIRALRWPRYAQHGMYCVKMCGNVLQCVECVFGGRAMHNMVCSVLLCVATCCSVLQCVAVCCSVLQCESVFICATTRLISYICIYIYVSICICVHVYIYTYIYIYKILYVCIYTYTYICVRICIYMHIYI